MKKEKVGAVLFGTAVTTATMMAAFDKITKEEKDETVRQKATRKAVGYGTLMGGWVLGIATFAVLREQ